MTLADIADHIDALLFTCSPKTIKIIWLSNLLILSVPDEGYTRNESSTKFDIYVLLYFENHYVYTVCQ